MTQTISISRDDILHQIKLSCQIPTIIEGIITRKIITDTAVAAGITVETKELQQAADSIRLLTKLHNAEATWTWLKKHSLSLDDFEELVYHKVISGKLAEHLFIDQVEPYFFEHQLDYTNVVMYEVLLNDEDLAMELFYSLQEGEISFFEIARQHIQDSELRRAGGYKGILRRADLKPEISAAVFATKPPKIIKPILINKNVHLIYVEELIQPQLTTQIRMKIISDLFSAWLKQQIEQVESALDLG